MNIFFKLYQWVFWNFFSRLLFVNLFLRIKFPFCSLPESHRIPKPPFLMVANHGTFFDPWIIGSYSSYPLAYMTNDDGFKGSKLSRWYLKNIGAFPKKKGASDYKAMKTTLTHLKNKKPVCIFPEGQTSWDGETQLLYTGIEKLIKRAECPLVTVRLQGNFLMKPWWAQYKRNGKIRVTMTVHPFEEIKTLSNEELFITIKQAIHQNDIKDPTNHSFAFRGKNCAEGLERFIWICLHCGAEDTLVMNGDTITCISCNSSWKMDAYCRIISRQKDSATCADLKDWADFHKIKVKEKVTEKQGLLTHSDKVVLCQENEQHTFIPIETGTLSLTSDNLYFKGTSVSLQWPVEHIEDYVIQKKDIFEFRHEKSYQRFLFSGKSPMKWVFYIRYLKGYEKCEQLGHL